MDATRIKIVGLQRGQTQKQLAVQASIVPRRWYRLIEGLAVATEEELVRVATVTGLSVGEIREALAGTSMRRADATAPMSKTTEAGPYREGAGDER